MPFYSLLKNIVFMHFKLWYMYFVDYKILFSYLVVFLHSVFESVSDGAIWCHSNTPLPKASPLQINSWWNITLKGWLKCKY